MVLLAVSRVCETLRGALFLYELETSRLLCTGYMDCVFSFLPRNCELEFTVNSSSSCYGVSSLHRKHFQGEDLTTDEQLPQEKQVSECHHWGFIGPPDLKKHCCSLLSVVVSNITFSNMAQTRDVKDECFTGRSLGENIASVTLSGYLFHSVL